MVELKLVWWPQFPTEEFEYHYLPLTATVGTRGSNTRRRRIFSGCSCTLMRRR